jgi:hypothetical protein
MDSDLVRVPRLEGRAGHRDLIGLARVEPAPEAEPVPHRERDLLANRFASASEGHGGTVPVSAAIAPRNSSSVKVSMPQSVW